ncbi:MAG: ABC transporter ATP-binding protein [Xanthomonadales bacterium]|nr:ABC transporter ATP-binding protein [Xanthomonadales bacterium]
MKLEAANISVAVRGARLVNEASFGLGGGELVGLIGPNGAGKSTLLKAVVGVGPRAAGTVSLDSRPLHSYARLERARLLAYLPQERRVEWRLSSREVVMLGRYPHQRGFGPPSDASRQAVERALSLVEAEPIADREFRVLSGGEKARVLLARALAVEAPILLADEPTAGLDPYHQLHVMEILRGIADAGVAVLIVLHDLTLAGRFADRLILMNRSRIVDSGPAGQVLTDANLKHAYSVNALRRDEGSEQFVVPWRRL